MPRTDFYILADNTDLSRFVCNITSKAWKQGHSLHILVDSKEQANTLDDLLWTFQDISFVPHALESDPQSEIMPITIGWEDKPKGDDVLVNLTETVPASASTYQRIVEFVAGNDSMRQQARQRYKQYRESGFEMHSHDMANGQESA